MAMRRPPSSSLAQRARTSYDQWLLRTKLLTRDSWSLMKSVVVSSCEPLYHDFRNKLKLFGSDSSPSSSSQQQRTTTLSWKDLLLTQANPPHYNAMAIKLLVAEKEMTLLRYHGMSTYARQKLEQARRKRRLIQKQHGVQDDDDNDDNDTSSNSRSNESLAAVSAATKEPMQPDTNTPKQQVARIAFMITASMKQDLNTLGFNEQAIKRLNPLQASLVLHHKVPIQELQDRLPILLQQHEEELQQQLQQLQREKEEREEEDSRRTAQSIMDLTSQTKEVQQQELQQVQHRAAEASSRVVEPMETSTPTTTCVRDGTTSPASSSSFFNFSSWQSQNELQNVAKSSLLSSSDEPNGTNNNGSSNNQDKWFELVQVVTKRRQPATTNDNHHMDDANFTKTNLIGEDEDEEQNMEMNNDTVYQVVALHKTREEAQFDLETRQEFANRRWQQQQLKLNGNGSSSSKPQKEQVATMEYQIRETTR